MILGIKFIKLLKRKKSNIKIVRDGGITRDLLSNSPYAKVENKYKKYRIFKTQ